MAGFAIPVRTTTDEETPEYKAAEKRSLKADPPLWRLRPADIVIADLLMPEMDGNDLIRQLRRTHPDLPIMLMTGHTTFGDEKESVAEGASVVLKKPIDPPKLLDALSNMVRF